MYDNRLQKGFAALTSTIIIAAVLLTLAVSVASSGFQGRFIIFDAEIKEVSRGLAEACIETAVLRYAQGDGDDYITTTTFPENDINIGTYDCSIELVSRIGAGTIEIRAQGEFQTSFTNIIAEFNDTSPYDITYWEEVAEF